MPTDEEYQDYTKAANHFTKRLTNSIGQQRDRLIMLFALSVYFMSLTTAHLITNGVFNVFEDHIPDFFNNYFFRSPLTSKQNLVLLGSAACTFFYSKQKINSLGRAPGFHIEQTELSESMHGLASLRSNQLKKLLGY